MIGAKNVRSQDVGYQPSCPRTVCFGGKPCRVPCMVGAKLYENSKYSKSLLQSFPNPRSKPYFHYKNLKNWLQALQNVSNKSNSGPWKVLKHLLLMFKGFFILAQQDTGQESCIAVLFMEFELKSWQAGGKSRCWPCGYGRCILAFSSICRRQIDQVKKSWKTLTKNGNSSGRLKTSCGNNWQPLMNRNLWRVLKWFNNTWANICDSPKWLKPSIIWDVWWSRVPLIIKKWDLWKVQELVSRSQKVWDNKRGIRICTTNGSWVELQSSNLDIITLGAHEPLSLSIIFMPLIALPDPSKSHQSLTYTYAVANYLPLLRLRLTPQPLNMSCLKEKCSNSKLW